MLTGTRIVLKPATLSDRRKIFEWLTQSDLTSKMMGPPDFEDNEIPSWEFFVDDYNPHFFDDEDPDQGRSYLIMISGKPIGHINYNEIDRNTNIVELDIWLNRSKHCNKGYGTEAINTLCLHLHNELGCNDFILAPSAAIRTYEKCGFHKADNPPDNFIPDYRDTVIMVRHF